MLGIAESLGPLNARVRLAFLDRFIGIVSRTGIEHGWVEPLIVLNRVYEALGLHIPVVVAREAVVGHDPLYRLVVVIDLFLDVALFVDGVAPGVAFLERQMSVHIEEELYRFIFGINERELLR